MSINIPEPIRLPTPPEEYDPEDQRQMRKSLEYMFNKLASSTYQATQVKSGVQAIPQGTVTIDFNGAWEFAVDVPPNANSARWDSSTSAFPADATVAAGGGNVITVTGGQLFTGSWSSGSSTGLISFGQSIFITLIPFTGPSATGATLPGVHIRGAFLQTTQTKYDTYNAASLTVANAYATAVVADVGGSGKLIYNSGHPTHAQSFGQIKISNGVNISNASIYVMMHYSGGGVGNFSRNVISFDAIAKSTQAFTNIAAPETDSDSSAVQLVTVTGLNHTVDSNANTYMASSLMQVGGGTAVLIECDQWNFTIGYTQSTANQGT